MSIPNKRWGFTTIANKYIDSCKESEYIRKVQLNSLFKAFCQWLALNKIVNTNRCLFSCIDLKNLIGYPEKLVNVFPLPEHMDELQIKSPDNYKEVITDMLSVSNDYYPILELCRILGVRVDFYYVHKYEMDEWITTPYVSLNRGLLGNYNGSFAIARYKNNYELITSRTFTTDIGINISSENKFILGTDFIIKSHRFTQSSNDIFIESYLPMYDNNYTISEDTPVKKRKTYVSVSSSTDDISEKYIEEFLEIRDINYDKLQKINDNLDKLETEYFDLEKDISTYIGIETTNLDSVEIIENSKCVDELSIKNSLLHNVLLTKISNIKKGINERNENLYSAILSKIN